MPSVAPAPPPTYPGCDVTKKNWIHIIAMGKAITDEQNQYHFQLIMKPGIQYTTTQIINIVSKLAEPCFTLWLEHN